MSSASSSSTSLPASSSASPSSSTAASALFSSIASPLATVPCPCPPPPPCTPSSNDIRWTNAFGHALISKQEFYIGHGDDQPYWYCLKCGMKKSEQKPEEGVVCNAIHRRFCHDKFLSACVAAFPLLFANNANRIQAEQEIEQHQWQFSSAFRTLRANLSPEWRDALDELEEEYFSESGTRQDFWHLSLDSILLNLLERAHGESSLQVEYECDSTSFHRKQNHGTCVDVQYGEWMQLWHDVANANDVANM